MHKYLFPEVLPATVPIAHAFFTAAVTETIAQRKFIDERERFRINAGIPYVAGLLLHSSLLGSGNAFGIWGNGLVGGMEIETVECQLERGTMDCQAAQDVADQLLLRFGFFTCERRLWPMEILRLKNCGSGLYLKAAQAHQPPLRDQLESMSDNFLPWTEVLRDMKRRECIPIRA
jgi:hypothetical protein